MTQAQIKDEVFMYRGHQLAVHSLVYPWGDAVQLGKLEFQYEEGGKLKTMKLPRGAFWRSNRDQARRTNGRTERQVYRGGAYDLLRAGFHIANNYGIHDALPGTETAELLSDRARIRHSVVRLMTRGASILDLEAWASSNYDDLVDRYRTKRDIRKVMARQDLERARQIKDWRGRKNVPAAGMASGAAIGNLDLRRLSIRYIQRYMDERTCNLADVVVRQARDVYRGIRADFEPFMVEVWAAQDSGLKVGPRTNFDPGWLDLIEDRTSWALIDKRLSHHLAALVEIYARPFVQNASHAIEDIEAARAAIEDDQPDILRLALTRLLEGTRWFFAQEFLQQRVIAPLSFLMEDLLRAAKLERRRTKQKGKIVITREMHPAAFDAVICQFRRFVKKFGKIDDRLLKSKVKPRLWPVVRAVFAAMKEDDWRKAKKNLLKIAALI